MNTYSPEDQSGKLIAAAVAVLFHLLILFILWLNGFHAILPQKEEGMEVMFGSVQEAQGTSVPKPIMPAEQVAVPAAPPAKATKGAEVITQTTDESVAIKEQKQRREKALEDARTKAEEQKRIAAEQLRRAEEQRRINEINARTSGAFGKGAQQGSGYAATGKGFQGSPNGNSTAGATTGSGGKGDTPSYSLDGRRPVGSLLRPQYTDQVEGVIVVEIVVTADGRVIDADIAISRTTIASRSMRDGARRAALQSRFNAIDGKENQMGSITYVYRFSH